MPVIANRVKVSTPTTGTGTITLGAAETGFQSFAAGGITNGQVVSYAIEDGAAWEIGTGTYNATGAFMTLTRTVIESSNADAKINLSGAAVVFITALSGDLQNAVDMDQGVATTDSPSFAGLTVDTNTLYVDAANNRVGIGTTAPSVLLDVANASGISIIGINAANTSASQLRFGDTDDADVGLIAYSHLVNSFQFFTNATERMRITSIGRIGIGTSAPTNTLDVNDDSIRVRTAQTPASASATGEQGEIAWDANYIYVCVATNTWKRAALSTW